MLGPAVEVEQLEMSGLELAGWTDLERLHSEEERKLHRLERIPSGRYHVKGGRGVGKAHVHVYDDQTGVYVNSRGEHMKLTTAQVRKKYEAGFQHRLGPALTEPQLVNLEPESPVEVPKPLDKMPSWVDLHSKVRVPPSKLIYKGQSTRVEFEARDALEKQAKYVPSVVYKLKVQVSPPPSGTKTSNTLGQWYNHEVYIHPEVTTTVAKPANGYRETAKEHQDRLNSTGWWSGSDPEHSMVDQVTAHETGHAVASDLGAQLAPDQQYSAGGWTIPGDVKMWQAIEAGVNKESGKSPTYDTPRKIDKGTMAQALAQGKGLQEALDESSKKPELALPLAKLDRSALRTETFDKGELERWIDKNYAILSATISRYATSKKDIKEVRGRQTRVVGQTTDPHELLAELWAEYTLKANPRAPAQAFGDYVMSNLAGRTQVPPARQGSYGLGG